MLYIIPSNNNIICMLDRSICRYRRWTVNMCGKGELSHLPRLLSTSFIYREAFDRYRKCHPQTTISQWTRAVRHRLAHVCLSVCPSVCLSGMLFDLFWIFLNIEKCSFTYYIFSWLWFHYIVDRDSISGFTR